MDDQPDTESAISLIAKVGSAQRLRYTVAPSANALLPADSLGGQLVALSKLFAALAKEDGYKLKTMIAGISMGDDGSISFELLIMPLEVAL